MFILDQKFVSSTLLSGVIATAVVVSGLKAGAQNARQLIAPEAVWMPGMTIMQDIKQECSSLSAPHFGECFVNGMQKSGASLPAVAFTRMIDNTGYMRDFRQVGRVSIAYVNFPFRANENQGAYLVNGTPSLIDIDDQSLLAKGELKENPVYTRLAKEYSEIVVFPGDRSGTSYLMAEGLPGGRQRFIVSYSLRDGCHACERVGTARFALDFDSAGKFLGTKLINVTASSNQSKGFTPLPTAKCEELQKATAQKLGVEVTTITSAFKDYISGKSGTGCLLTAMGTGKEFSSPAKVIQELKAMLTAKGWVEETAYGAGGPTGMSTGFRQSKNLGLLRVEWEPASGVKCPSDQPIASCAIAPQQKHYTITLNLAQL